MWQYETAYNAGDAEPPFTPLMALIPMRLASPIRGRLEIANGLKELLAGPLKGTRITINPLQVRALSSDVAVEEASFSLTGLKGPSGADLPPVTGICIGVYQKQGHLWFAAAVQCMAPPPTS